MADEFTTTTSTNGATAGQADKADMELAAMSTVRKALADLEDDSRQRVLDWVLNYFGYGANAGAPSTGVRLRPGQVTMPSDDRGAAAEDQTSERQQQYSDFADFYHAAHPGTEGERALVGGYWFQVLQSKSDFEAGEVNAALNALGFRVSNIAARLTELMALRPAPVIQTGKSSGLKAAHKRYRLTDHGIRRVRQMLAPAHPEEEQ